MDSSETTETPSTKENILFTIAPLFVIIPVFVFSFAVIFIKRFLRRGTTFDYNSLPTTSNDTTHTRLFPDEEDENVRVKSGKETSCIFGLFDNANYGLDDLFIVKRFSIVIILMLIIGFICYSSITNERLKRRTLEATFQYTTTFTKIILLVAINSFLLKYILRHYVLKTLRLRGDEKVLNVACGTGFFLNGIASQLDAGRGGMVTGVDIFETYVDKERVFPIQPVIRLADTIQNVAAMNNQSKAEVYNGFPFELEMLPSDTYDIVFISPTAILIQQKEIEAAFKQWKRVLKPGGKLVICDIFINAGFTRKRLELSGWNHVHTGYPHWYLMAPVFLHSAIKRTSAVVRTTDSSSPSLALASFTSRPGSSSSLEMRSSASTDPSPNTNIVIKESFELEDNDDDEMKYKTLSPATPAYMLPTSPFYWRVWYTLAIGIVAAIIGGIAIPITNFFFPGEKLANYF